MMDRKVYASNGAISLVEYHKCDDRALYENWQDVDTQKGYNGVYYIDYEAFEHRTLKNRFFAMIKQNSTGELIGAVGVSRPETTPDLAIWIFKPYRRKGFGTAAFALTTKYLTEVLEITELHAGAFPDNAGSQKMLRRCGYAPYPAGNISEKHYITGEDIVQMDYIYSPIVIRLAVRADAPDMAVVHMRSWEAAYKDIVPEEYIREKNALRPALWERVLSEANTTQYIIKKDGKTAGMMGIGPSRDEDAGGDVYELMGLYLLPEYFRQGIGSQTMEFAFNKSREVGYKTMTVWLLTDNLNAKRFYEKCGFAEDGKTETRNFGRPLVCVRMRRDL